MRVCVNVTVTGLGVGLVGNGKRNDNETVFFQEE